MNLGKFIDQKDIFCISPKNSELHYAISKSSINEINDIIYVNLTNKISLKIFIKRKSENISNILFLKNAKIYKIRKNKLEVLKFLKNNLNFVRFEDKFVVLKKETSGEKINFKLHNFEIQIDKNDIIFFPLKTLESIKKLLKLLKVKKLNFNNLNVFLSDTINSLTYEFEISEFEKNYNFPIYKSNDIKINKISATEYKISNEFKNDNIELINLKKLGLLIKPAQFELLNNIVLLNGNSIALKFNENLPYLIFEFETFLKNKKLILNTIEFLSKSKFLNLIYYFSNESIQKNLPENSYLNIKKLDGILKNFKKEIEKIENFIKIIEI